MSDTIVALATPPGKGGVGIIRLSGLQSLNIALKINGNKSILPRMATYCCFYNSSLELIDQGLIIYFKSPNSFTGEDVIEFQAHGAPIVLDLLIKECIYHGARLALPGEFSQRAFLNEKIDLAQAEAIADLIQAHSQTAARMAIQTLQGNFSKQIQQLNEQLIHLRLYVEAAIDFPEEEIDFLNDGKIAQMLNLALNKLNDIRNAANQGVIIRDGLTVVIAGRPNAGKSTLINLLASKEVAIVSEIAGTTRDIIHEHISLDEIPLHIIDTAGLQDTEDKIEKEGIKRAWNELKKADCVLLVVDINDHEPSSCILDELKNVLSENIPIVTIFNKIDKLQLMPKSETNQVYLSAKTGLGLDLLKKIIKQIAGYQETEGHFLARRRHLDALDKAQRLLLEGALQLKDHLAGELLAEDLRLAHRALGEITGEFTSDDLLGEIFSNFCIGK